MQCKHLILIGGAHGVGKSTVISQLIRELPQLHEFDPGELFWKYHFDNSMLSTEAIEKMIADALCGLLPEVVMVNWHYAVWRPDGYIPQMPFELLEKVLEQYSFSRITLIHLTLPDNELYRRRRVDIESGVKKRKLDMEAVRREISESERLYHEHMYVVQRVLPDSNRGFLELVNMSSSATARHITKVLK